MKNLKKTIKDLILFYALLSTNKYRIHDNLSNINVPLKKGTNIATQIVQIVIAGIEDPHELLNGQVLIFSFVLNLLNYIEKNWIQKWQRIEIKMKIKRLNSRKNMRGTNKFFTIA